MIFLFCNQTYGARFIEQMVRFSNENKVALTIVFSAKKRSTHNRFRGLLAEAKSLVYRVKMKLFFKYKHDVNFTYVSNVNNAAFVRLVQSEDVGFVTGFNQIFHSEIIGRFRCFVNFHPSLLPYYKGPVPSRWCVAGKESFSGFTMHEISPNVDSGKILYQEVVAVSEDDDEQSLDRKIAETASGIMVKYADSLFLGKSFEFRILNADNYYKNKLGYAGFE